MGECGRSIERTKGKKERTVARISQLRLTMVNRIKGLKVTIEEGQGKIRFLPPSSSSFTCSATAHSLPYSLSNPLTHPPNHSPCKCDRCGRWAACGPRRCETDQCLRGLARRLGPCPAPQHHTPHHDTMQQTTEQNSVGLQNN